MNRLEKLAAHALFYLVFTALFLNATLLFNLHIDRWSLPLTYVLYVAGLVAWRLRKGSRPTWHQALLIVVVPLTLLLVAKGLSQAYDTSWDGQDYQQSAIIELHAGWNPWHSNTLPLKLPGGQLYTLGYPKTTWLIQSSIYALTGNIQMVMITNVVVAGIAAILVLGVLRRIGLNTWWRWVVTVFAVLELHALQQMPTFMADGYSYELSLIAIAALLLTMMDRVKTWPMLSFLSAWLLLTGSKFSNLLVCALLGVVCLVYLWRVKAYQWHWLRYTAVGFVLASFLLLWVPYGKNMITHHSPVWPQNLPSESAKLRFDNVPNNLKHSNHFELLFYGIFSHTEPPTAGNALSKDNVAALKVPFTFHTYEIGEINNFQGRVGSAGVFFSGIIVLATIAYGLIVWRRADLRSPRLLRATSILMALIVGAALVIPVPNKLRYSPLITLVPLIILVLLANFKHQKHWWIRTGQGLLVVFVTANFVLGAANIVLARIHEASVINHQLSTLRQTHQTYRVSATAFYANYVRLQEHGIPIVITPHVSCQQPISMAYTYSTATLCPAQSSAK